MNYETQTGIGAVAKKRIGVGAAAVPTILYVEHDPGGGMCPACNLALSWADNNGGAGTISAPAGMTDAGGYAIRLNDDPGMPAELQAKLATIGVNSVSYPAADIGGTIVSGFNQQAWDAAVSGKGVTPAPPQGGGGTPMSTGTKVAIVGALVAAGAAVIALTDNPVTRGAKVYRINRRHAKRRRGAR